MTLAELKKRIDQIIKMAGECGEPIEEIAVSVQVDDSEGGSRWFDDVAIHYDNNTETSGCVILGLITYCDNVCHTCGKPALPDKPWCEKHSFEVKEG